MMKATWAFLAIMTINALLSTASAETPASEKLKGTWIVDAKATEEFLKNSPPPTKDSVKFLDISAIMFQLIYEFDDEIINAYIYNGDKRTTYRLVPQKSDKIEYVSEKKQGISDDFLTISAISDKNIIISSSQNQVMSYFVFKRVKLDPKTRMHDAELAMEDWKVAIKDIAKILTIPPNPAVNSNAARSSLGQPK